MAFLLTVRIQSDEHGLKKERDACTLKLTSMPTETPNTAAFILDLDYFLAREKGVTPKNAMKWIENAHTKIEDIFEGCITDRLRSLFGVVE